MIVMDCASRAFRKLCVEKGAPPLHFCKGYWFSILQCVLLVLYVSTSAFAGQKVLQAKHKTLVGDNDSRHDAEQMCYAEAKRKALEQAGVVVRSLTETKNYTLERDMVQVVTAAVASIEEVEDVWRLEGDQLSVTCSVRVTVDEERLQRRMEAAADNMQYINPDNGKLRVSGPMGAKSQTGTEGLLPSSPASDDILSDAARTSVSKWQTMQAVYGELGEPQMVRKNKRAGHIFQCLRYGRTWLVFRDQQALCAKKRLDPEKRLGVCHCAGAADSFYWR